MSPTLQSGPNTGWLDEELRKDRAILTDLRDLVDKQQVTLVDQAQRIMQLEDTATKLRAQLLRIAEVEEALQHTRDHVGILIAEQHEDFTKRQTEFLRNRQAEREADVRALSEVRLELERFAPLEQAMAVRQAEEQRINEMALRLGGALEVLDARVRQAEDQRRQLRDGIQRNDVEIKKAVEATGELRATQVGLAARLLAVEDQLPRLGAQTADLQTMRQELTERQEEMLENQRRAERVRAQQMTEWGRRLEGYAHQLETWADQLRYFADQYEKNRRVLRDTQALAQELSQKQDQLRQVQLLADDQLRRELREFQRENEARWAQERQRREQIAASQVEREDTQDGRIEGIDTTLEALQAALGAIEGRLGAVQREAQAESARIREIEGAAWERLGRDLTETVSTLRASLAAAQKE